MLKISHISKTFNPGTINEKVALSDFSLTVNDEDFITIIGSNGAGKSTLFNAIAGSFITDSGSIELDGTDITMMLEHRRAKYIGRLFQDPMLGSAPGMTIEENLFLASGRGSWIGKIKLADRKDFRERLALLDMGLENRMDHPVGLLSGGQRQALTLLMATINPPKILLLDEHTAALDPKTAEKVISLTKKIVQDNKLTCLMITHNMHQALELGNRVIMMDGGRIVFDGAGEEKKNMSTEQLLTKFRDNSGKAFDNDRILLS